MRTIRLLLVLSACLLPFSGHAFSLRTSFVCWVNPKGSCKSPLKPCQYPPPRPRSARASTATASIEAEESPKEPFSYGTSTVTASIFNLVKGIVGAGVLSLPAGIAAFGNAPSAIVPAVGLIAVIGALSGYCFSLIGRVCSMTGASSYRGGWEQAVGTKSSWVPAVSVLLKTLTAVLAYSMILADTSNALLATAGVSATRTQSLVAITTIVLLPLCWLKNLSSLAPFSLLGSLGMLYTAIAMGIRYLQKAYAIQGGSFQVDQAFQPSFGAIGAKGVFSANSFILISMLSTAFMAHFNAPKFKQELKDSTVHRYNTVVGISFGISIILFSLISSIGFLTFGGACNGLILNNYANSDTLMSISRFAVLLSLVFSYPLAFTGAREGVLDMFKIKDRSNAMLNKVTLICLSLVTGAACTLKDVSFVLAFAGATLGNALIYIFPSLMFRESVNKLGDDATNGQKLEANAAVVTAGLGLGMGLIGAFMAVKALMLR